MTNELCECGHEKHRHYTGESNFNDCRAGLESGLMCRCTGYRPKAEPPNQGELAAFAEYAQKHEDASNEPKATPSLEDAARDKALDEHRANLKRKDVPIDELALIEDFFGGFYAGAEFARQQRLEIIEEFVRRMDGELAHYGSHQTVVKEWIEKKVQAVAKEMNDENA